MTPDTHADERPNAMLRHRSMASFDRLVQRIDRLEERLGSPGERKVTDLLRRVRRLEQADLATRLDTLTERLERIEKMLNESGVAIADELLPKEWGLTGQQAAMLRALADQPQGYLHKEGIYLAMYGEITMETPHPKILDVVMCQLRKKVAPFGIVIETVWGRGYQLTAESYAIVRHHLVAGREIV